jgi:ribosomal protein L7/L12
MAIIGAKCTQCGANIVIDDKKDIGICEHCGMSFIIEKTINNYTINNINIISSTQEPTTPKQYIINTEVDESDMLKIAQLIKANDKISAIKMVRELSGIGLKDARYFVENFYNIDTSKPNKMCDIPNNKHTIKTTNDAHRNIVTTTVILICLTIGIALGIYDSIDIINQAKNESTKNNIAQTEITASNKYLTEISWALTTNYYFAVEIDDFTCDVVQEGTYRFYPDCVILENKNVPIVWDIYVSNELYSNISELHDNHPDFVGSVGGWNKDEITINLKKGKYVYVKCYAATNNETTGYLKIKKVDN